MKPTPKQRYWLDHIEKATQSGLSYSAYAQQEKLNLKALYNWKFLLAKKGLIATSEQRISPFVKIKPSNAKNTSPKQAHYTESWADITLPNGVLIRYPELTPELLQNLVAL